MLGENTGGASKETNEKLNKMLKKDVLPKHMRDIPLEHMYFCQLMSLGGTAEWAFERCFPKLVEVTDDWKNQAMQLYERYKPFIVVNKKKLSGTTQAMPGTIDWIMSMYIVQALDQRERPVNKNKALQGMVDLIRLKQDNRYKELLIEEKKIHIERMREPEEAEAEVIDYSKNDKDFDKLSIEEQKKLAEELYNKIDIDKVQDEIIEED